MKLVLRSIFVVSSIFLTACGGGSSSTPPTVTPPPQPPVTPTIDYSVTVQRSQYGIPHIKADDWGSLGFGSAYAYAQDNFCILMREVVFANGLSQRYFGEDGNLAADYVFKLLGEDAADIFYGQQPQRVKDLMRGYTEGFNHYLSQTGADQLTEGTTGCRNAPWVRSITVDDLAKVTRRVMTRASTAAVAPLLTAAAPPPNVVKAKTTVKLNKHEQLALIQKMQLALQDIPQLTPTPAQLGSNAYALGSSSTQSGVGMLLGNPHFPWQGGSRFYMQHLTMADEYNVFGAGLHGSPVVNIGFNNQVAWTHTVSTAKRFVLYELTLDPDNNQRYEYDGKMVDLTSKTVSTEVQTSNGVETQEHTFYFSQYGPILDLGAVSPLLEGWPNKTTGTLFAIKDANLTNNRAFDQWIKIGLATDIAGVQDALKTLGIPWVNTIAVDRAGTAFYGDISVVPHLLNEQRATCIAGIAAPLLTSGGLTTLDGSNPACALGNDADTDVEGIFGYDSLPKLTNTTYAANANDSYWLSNPSSLLTGFPEIIGMEDVEQTRRTRLTFLQVEQRLAASDGLDATAGYSLSNLQETQFSSRNLAGEGAAPALISACKPVTDWSSYSTNTAEVDQACDLIENWDTKHNNNSVGAHIFVEFWKVFSDSDEFATAYSIPFDAADPVNTPRDINTGNAAVIEALRNALADAVDTLVSNNIALNTPLGQVQYSTRKGVRIPIHGGPSGTNFSVISSELVANEGYSNIVHGNSYMQTVTWDGDCPNAGVLLSYSQSTDETSDHYADMTQLYSDKQWVDAPYCQADIDAAQISVETLSVSVDE